MTRSKYRLFRTSSVIRKISTLLYPVIPNSSLKALSIFNIKENDIDIQTIKNNEFLKTGMEINKINIYNL